jgi:uncharacterized membrane protein
LASFHLLLVLVAVEAQLVVLVELQVWLVVRVQHPFLCADLCEHKMSAQTGLDG